MSRSLAAMRAAHPALAAYWDAVEDFCRRCREDLPHEFLSFIVTGSLGVGDALPGWSDVDGYLVVRSASEATRRKVAGLAEAMAVAHPFLATDRGSRFSVFIVTKEDLHELRGEASFLSVWDLKAYGIVACGEDLLPALGDPPLDRDWLDRQTDWMIGFLVREEGATSFWRGMNSIGFILTGARYAVLKRGEYAKEKEDVARRFASLYPERVELLRRAMDHRARWREVQRDHEAIQAIHRDAVPFLRWVRDLP